MRSAIWYHLYNFKNVKNTHGGVLKVILFRVCFSPFLNYTNGTKSRKASHISISNLVSISDVIKIKISEKYFLPFAPFCGTLRFFDTFYDILQDKVLGLEITQE